MIGVVHSCSAAERIDAARRFLAARPPGDNLLIVGPTREAADDLAHAVAADHGATFGFHRLSLRQLAERLAAPALADRGAASTTRLGTEAVAARATFEVRQGGRLRYFEPVAGCPGFARSVAATLTEARLAGVGADDVRPLRPAGEDLAALLEEFETQLAEAAVADAAGLMAAAIEAVETVEADADAPDMLDWPLLLLDVPVRDAAERRLVRALATRAPECLVTIPDGDAAAAEAVADLATSDAAVDPGPEGVANSSLVRLQRHLFATEPPPAGEPDDEVQFFSAPGEARECVEIARRIVEEARGGVPFDRMAVLVRVPGLYTSLLETALRRAEVPAYFARGTSRPDPSGRALLALLACAAERLSAVRFAEYLSLGEVPDATDAGAPPTDRDVWAPPVVDSLPQSAAPLPTLVQGALPFDPPDPPDPPGLPGLPDPPGLPDEADSSTRSARPAGSTSPVVAGTLRAPWKWEELLVEAAVIGSRERWMRRLDGLDAELAMKAAELRSEEPDAPRLLALERERANLGHLRRFALPIVEVLDDFPAEATWGEWLDRLTALAGMSLRHPERVVAVLSELRPMSVVGPVRLEEVRDVLLERLATLEVEPPSRRYGRVFVATPDQARGRSFDVVFVPGLAERVFPQKAREDPLLLDEAREALGAGRLRTQRDRAPDERLLLRLAVGAARRRVHLSYPRMGTALGEPRPRVPSFYGLDVERALRGRIPDIEQLQHAAAAAAQARLAWPAPPEPTLAIDEIEHDLSVLDRLMHAPAGTEVRGRAQYLLRLNTHLARSLRGRWGRWEVPQWTQLDGLTRATPATTEALARHRLHARPYSVSALQHYAACPYRFLLSAIYRLEPREEAVPLQHLDPLTRGSIFHEVQAEFLRAMERAGRLPIEEGRLADARAMLDETLDRVAAERRDELAPAIPRVWNDEIDDMRTDLRAWLNALAEDRDWRPLRFELGFGMSADRTRDPNSVEEPAVLEGGYQLRGIVDLIERRHDGALRITDHKTGADRTEPGLIVGHGETLQPVLYGLAIEQATGERVDSARLFFCTRRGGFGERAVALDRLAREHGLAVLQQIDRAIADGFLPPAPRERACAYCDFSDVCGPHEETRVRRKDQRALEPLMALRRRP